MFYGKHLLYLLQKQRRIFRMGKYFLANFRDSQALLEWLWILHLSMYKAMIYGFV